MSPAYLEVGVTLKKIVKLIKDATKKSAKLIVFPELILSGYPNFSMSYLSYRQRYIDSAIRIDGPEIHEIANHSKENSIIVVLGFAERHPNFPEVIYNSSCVIDSDGVVLGTHRKIAPFGAEKVVFQRGDASDIRLFETSVGKIGIGLCFENLNPLYRRALTVLGEELHCALWVTSEEAKHIVESSAVVEAVEGGVFVAVSSQVTSNPTPQENGMQFIGGSSVLDPLGKYLVEPMYRNEKTIYTEIDPVLWDVKKIQSRGIESRDDLLSLNIATEAYRPYFIKNQKYNEAFNIKK
jgi:predicted amidohydrolase